MRILGGQLIHNSESTVSPIWKNLEKQKAEADFEEIIEFIQNHFDPNYDD
jgi:hypothetical protein